MWVRILLMDGYFFVKVGLNCKYKCPSKMRGELTIEEEIIVWLWKQ